MSNASFRSKASFGKRIELWVAGLLLKEGFDVFLPLVDDDGIDMILRGAGGRKLDIQVKARSNEVKFGNCGLFHNINHETERSDYYFLLYSERLGAMWFMASNDFMQQSTLLSSGKRNLGVVGRKKGIEVPKDRYRPWLIGENNVFDFAPIEQALNDLVRRNA